MSAGSSTTVFAGGHDVRLTNLDKVYYPSAHVTKGEVLDYYVRVSPVLLPHLRDRPLVLKRYPEGIDGEHFYQKSCPSGRPDWLDTAPIGSSSRDGDIEYCLANDLSSLLWLVNQGCLEFHAFLSRFPDVDRPTTLMFDLDPGPGTGLEESCRVGLALRDVLHDDGLEPLAKVSGGKRLHVHAGLEGASTFEATKDYARTLGRRLERESPGRITANQRKANRQGRVLVDWGQNSAHKSTIVPYSLRARDPPTVACPVFWSEVEAAAAGGTDDIKFSPEDAKDRIGFQGDLMQGVLDAGRPLPVHSG